MRFSLFLLALTMVHIASGQILDSSRVRFDGFYQTKAEIDKDDNDTTYSYLRFYPDGKVLSVTSEGTVFDLKEWFNLKMDSPSVGKYKINGKRLSFSTISRAGTVMYEGKVDSQNYLVLKSKSLINGYKDREKYYFIEISDLK